MISPRTAFFAILASSFLAAPIAARAQTPKLPTIGMISLEFPNDDSGCVARFERGFGELGYVEGKTHLLEKRFAEDRADQLPGFAADLVRLNVDVIVSASTPAAAVVKNATATIPIVLASSFYPVESGLIASLARPGGNITGVTHFTPELMAKRVQLLRELLPKIARVAVLRSPGRLDDLVVGDIDAAARPVGMHLRAIEVRRPEELSAAFESAVKGRAQAIMSTQGPFFRHHRAEIARLALKHRLPSLSGEPTAAEAGALLFYGPNVIDGCTRAATFVDRILKGARPADLPVEQPTKITMVINLKTARALGLTIPPALLLRADHVVE
jgi:putative tryptophan/tyrosine transport system substrate-binding protein